MAAEVMTLAELLRTRAAARDSAVALIDGETRISYRQLLERSEHLGVALAQRGVLPGDRVMIVGENSIEQIVAFFAATLAGAWPVLVNARMTAREVDAIRAHCAPRLVLYVVQPWPDAAEHARRHGATAPAGSLLAWSAVDEAARPEDGEQAQQVAALIYTSGTTGSPKGVMVTHRGLLHFARRSAEVRQQGPDDAVLAALPMAHIFGIATIMLTTIWAGGRLVLMPRFDPAEAHRVLRVQGIGILHGVPSLYSRLMAWLEDEGLAADYPALRYVYVGGGALDPELKRRIETLLGRPAHHGYGMTEYAGSMFVTHVDAPRGDALPGVINPDCEARFVDEAGHDVGAGQSGEIWIRGPGTMLGYYRAPELTAEVLTPDGWLKTGDVGCLQADGALRIVGRQRDIIKSAGFIVYPAEVEAELLRVPGIRAAAVLGLPNRHGDEDVMAVVELQPGTALDRDALLRLLRTRLAGYKLPRRIEVIDAMPLTLNGKVRKPELRARWLT